MTVVSDWIFGIPSKLEGITNGGLGGTIIPVTNANASGPGSLLAAIEAEGPRVVVFEIGGVIDLDGATLVVVNDDITIAGHTAPSPGVTIIRGGLRFAADDFVITHLRVRPGDRGLEKGSGWEKDAITTSGAKRGIIDHCTAMWATDECLSASGARFDGANSTEWRAATSSDIAITNNIIAECLCDSTHSLGPHSRGTLVHDNVRSITIAYNLYAGNDRRHPLAKGGASVAIINNLIVGLGETGVRYELNAAQWAGRDYEEGDVDVIGNVFQPTRVTLPYDFSNPSLTSAVEVRGAGTLNLHMDDNYFSWLSAPVDFSGGVVTIVTPGTAQVAPAEIDYLLSADVRAHVLANAGARPWDRDATDARIITQSATRKIKIIDSQDEREGYPAAGIVSTRALNASEWDLESIGLAPVGGTVPA